jgi:hypothetical protein
MTELLRGTVAERIGETVYLDDDGQDDQADVRQDDDPGKA